MDIKKIFVKNPKPILRAKSLKPDGSFEKTRKRVSIPMRPISMQEATSSTLAMQNFLPEMKVSTKKQQQLEVIKCNVQNCRTLDAAFEILTSKIIKDQYHPQPDAVLLYKFTIIRTFVDFGWRQSQLLNKKFANKSVLIFVSSVRKDNIVIYWKTKDVEELLKLVPYNEKFDENDKLLCEFVAKFLKKSLKKGRLGLHSNFSSENDGTRIQLHLLANHHDHNLLMSAAKIGNASIVNSLLKYHIPMELPKTSITVQDIAWKNGQVDLVLSLVESNFPYPKSMTSKKCSEKLKNFIAIAEELHKAMKSNDCQVVQKLLTQNSNQKYFYYPSNVSALKGALMLENWEIYQLLIENGCEFGPHEDTTELLARLNQVEKSELMTIHSQFLRDFNETHINFLMSNSYLSSKGSDDKVRFDLILKAYKALDDNRYTKSILKVIAASKIICVIFDFEQESVSRIDPNSDPGAYTFLNTTGRIVIGAKQLLKKSTEHETFAVLAHELCHYAIHLTFGNTAKPYAKNDAEAMENFEEISKSCMESDVKESIIEYVYLLYPEKFQHAELIACVPHLFILYHDQREKLCKIIEDFKSLFNFYVVKIMTVMENQMNFRGKDKENMEEIEVAP